MQGSNIINGITGTLHNVKDITGHAIDKFEKNLPGEGHHKKCRIHLDVCPFALALGCGSTWSMKSSCLSHALLRQSMTPCWTSGATKGLRQCARSVHVHDRQWVCMLIAVARLGSDWKLLPGRLSPGNEPSCAAC